MLPQKIYQMKLDATYRAINKQVATRIADQAAMIYQKVFPKQNRGIGGNDPTNKCYQFVIFKTEVSQLFRLIKIIKNYM